MPAPDVCAHDAGQGTTCSGRGFLRSPAREADRASCRDGRRARLSAGSTLGTGCSRRGRVRLPGKGRAGRSSGAARQAPDGPYQAALLPALMLACHTFSAAVTTEEGMLTYCSTLASDLAVAFL